MKMESLKKNVIVNNIRVFSNLLLPLITFPYVARILMPDNLGKVTFATSVIEFLVILATLGIPLYGVREAVKVKHNKLELTRVTHELLFINLLFTLLSYMVLVLLILLFPSFHDYKSILLIMSLNILLTTVGIEWLYQALEKYVYITIRSLIFKLIFIVLVFSFIKNESDYLLYAFFVTFAAVGSNILNLINARKFIYFKNVKNYQFKKHLKPIFIMMAMNLAISVYINMDVVMLGLLVDDYAVGIYSVSIKLAKIALAVVTSVGAILMARITVYLQHDNKSELEKLLLKATDFIFFTSLPIVTVVIFYSDTFIHLISGVEYAAASTTLKILIFIIVALGLSNLVGVQVLIPLGKEKLTLYSVIAGAAISFVLNIILIPKYSYNGAAISTLITEISVTLIQVSFAWKHIKAALFTKNKVKYLIASIVLSAGLLLCQLVDFNQVIINLIFAGVVSCFIYFSSLILMRDTLMKEIIAILRNLTSRLKRNKVNKGEN